MYGFDIINNWDTELKEMNQNKIGEGPFHYPNTFLLLLLGYAKYIFICHTCKPKRVSHKAMPKEKYLLYLFTTINRKIHRLDKDKNADYSMKFKDEYIVIAIDSTGIKVTNRGQWLREKWHIKNNNKKGYLEIHVAVNIKTKKILAMMKVTGDEHVHDSKALPELVNDVMKSDKNIAIGKLFDDGSYEANEIFRFLAVDNEIHPSIKVRKNARIRMKKGKNIIRNLSVLTHKNNLQKWKDRISYKKRCWIVETVFSSIKRRFVGEYVYSVKLKNMIQEMMLKASLHNKLMSALLHDSKIS